MLEKLNKMLFIFGAVLPSGVREFLKEVASEIDRLRSEVNELRSQTDDGK